jgi:hypothetical protein
MQLPINGSSPQHPLNCYFRISYLVISTLNITSPQAGLYFTKNFIALSHNSRK